ncbi:tripartite tricarboxylate transporter permease [Bacillus sp. Marseille-P3661]|uniref:tripartite tricarboxylate transporter permease n=1 Tax=Bacillus sp. Marseille-P3661 TaxID=1936234 RepID=UPI000C820574|nr:tripartite tricarboxylate transporter permease [Bacillus sp. Marseille-P3661]
MIEYIIPVLVDMLSWPSVLFLVLGSLIGLVFGILPGLGGPQVLALLLPMTFTMESNDAIVLLIGAAGAVAIGGSLTAILIGTPGTPQNAATVFDGFPLTKQGKAGQAIGAATASSVLGAIFGAVILTIILPVGKYVVLAFSYPEYFMMAFMGLAMIAILSQGLLWKGIIAGGVGLMVSFIGFDPVTGETRYVFGSQYLWDGVKLVPALIGLFAISEAMSLFVTKGKISNEKVNTSYSGVKEGILAVFKNFGLFIRSSVIGTIIGIIPGVGGAVSNFLAYGQAVSSTKGESNFGKGDIRGIIAPEASNNAKDGGALVPTLIFGIPGSLEMAVLLGALTLHGIQPGPRLMLDHADVALSLIYALVFANIIVGIVAIFAAAPLARLTQINTVYIAPVIMVFAILGSYAAEGMIGDVIVTIIFGIIGFAMRMYDYSRVALVIALVLGEMMQQSFHQTLDLLGPTGFFTRPVSLILFLITAYMFVRPIIKAVSKKGGTKDDKWSKPV